VFSCFGESPAGVWGLLLWGSEQEQWSVHLQDSLRRKAGGPQFDDGARTGEIQAQNIHCASLWVSGRSLHGLGDSLRKDAWQVLWKKQTVFTSLPTPRNCRHWGCDGSAETLSLRFFTSLPPPLSPLELSFLEEPPRARIQWGGEAGSVRGNRKQKEWRNTGRLLGLPKRLRHFWVCGLWRLCGPLHLRNSF
jgi:hypothetical protein